MLLLAFLVIRQITFYIMVHFKYIFERRGADWQRKAWSSHPVLCVFTQGSYIRIQKAMLMKDLFMAHFLFVFMRIVSWMKSGKRGTAERTMLIPRSKKKNAQLFFCVCRRTQILNSLARSIHSKFTLHLLWIIIQTKFWNCGSKCLILF